MWCCRRGMAASLKPRRSTTLLDARRCSASLQTNHEPYFVRAAAHCCSARRPQLLRRPHKTHAPYLLQAAVLLSAHTLLCTQLTFVPKQDSSSDPSCCCSKLRRSFPEDSRSEPCEKKRGSMTCWKMSLGALSVVVKGWHWWQLSQPNGHTA